MIARTHPGRVLHCWDHYVVTLRDGGVESAMLSLYAVAYSATVASGTVAFLRVPGMGIEVALADRVSAGRAMQRRLLGMGTTWGCLDRDPILARFERVPRDGGMGWRIVGGGLEVEAAWDDLAAPFWMEAPAPSLLPDEDIRAAMVAARSASIAIDGHEVSGEAYADDVWVPKIGRPLSSAHVALGEVRVSRSGPA